MRMDVGISGHGRRPQGPGPLLVVCSLLLALAPTWARAQSSAPDSVTLLWTAPGDDDQVGTATAYEMRMSASAISSSNWDAATVVPGMPAPLVAGTHQSTVVRGLTPGATYYFAIKTVDNAGNWSGLSNVVKWDGSGNGAPSAPRGVRGSKRNNDKVQLVWDPNPEPDVAGYNVYRSLDQGGPYSRLNSSLVTSAQYDDNAIPAGTKKVWYQVTAMDSTSNESAPGATSVDLEAQAATWAIQGGYPNPSPAGSTVRFPLAVSGPGGNASLEIVNSVGQRVRRVDLGTLPPGSTVAQWDGRNDAGREVAPGVYTAWLVANSTRIGVRLARVP